MMAENLRILFACLPAYGHLYPVMPLAQACRDAGHDVVIATGPEAAGRLSANGWQVEVVDADTAAAAREVMGQGLNFRELPPPQRWRFGAAMFGDVLCRKVSAELGPIISRQQPDLVVYEEMNLGASLAAGRAGIPAVRHGLGPALPPEMLDSYLGMLADQWRAGGEEPPEPNSILGQLCLDIWPSGLRQPPSALPMPSIALRPTPWSEPGLALPELFSGPYDRPRVYLTLGTVTPGAPGMVGVLRTVLDGLADQDADVLVSIGPALDKAVLGVLPPRVHLEAFVPGAQVLPLVDLVIHHGGSGTTLGSMAAGRPQLVLPQVAHDQFINASAVAGSGAGAALMPGQVSAEAVGREAARLLGPGTHRQQAQVLAQQIRDMPAPAAVLESLADLVGQPVGRA